MHIIAFILIVFVLLLFIGLSLVSSVIGFFLRLLGIRRRTPRNYSQRTHSQQENYRNKEASASPKKNKIFEDDEGEYVDFEEVKEEN